MFRSRSYFKQTKTVLDEMLDSLGELLDILDELLDMSPDFLDIVTEASDMFGGKHRNKQTFS